MSQSSTIFVQRILIRIKKIAYSVSEKKIELTCGEDVFFLLFLYRRACPMCIVRLFYLLLLHTHTTTHTHTKQACLNAYIFLLFLGSLTHTHTYRYNCVALGRADILPHSTPYRRCGGVLFFAQKRSIHFLASSPVFVPGFHSRQPPFSFQLSSLARFFLFPFCTHTVSQSNRFCLNLHTNTRTQTHTHKQDTTCVCPVLCVCVCVSCCCLHVC